MNLESELKAKSRQFYQILRENSVSQEDPIPEWTLIHDVDGDGSKTCICSQAIVHEYTIQNTINGRTLIIGSECIKRWEIKVKCKICSAPLGNITARLRKENYTCPQCARIERQKEKIKEKQRQERIRFLESKRLFWYGKYYMKTFKEVLQDLTYVDYLVNVPTKTATLVWFEEYVGYFYDLKDVEVTMEIV